MKYFSFLCFCFVICTFSEIKSANIESTIRLGDSLFLNKNYTYALLEYQRAYFFSGSELKSQTGERIAECHFVMDDFAWARAYYDSAIYYSKSELLKINYEFRKITCYILEGNFGYALLRINDLEAGEDINLDIRKNFYQGICHYGMKQFDDAYSHFLSSVPEKDTVKINQLKLLFENQNSFYRPYPGLAVMLSMVLPGAGQVYSDAFKDGVNSFFLVVGLAYIGISGPASGLIVLLPFIYRYYIGGILNAKKAAEYKQQVNQYLFYSKLLPIFRK